MVINRQNFWLIDTDTVITSLYSEFLKPLSNIDIALVTSF